MPSAVVINVHTPPINKPKKVVKSSRKPPQDIGIPQLLLGAERPSLADATLAARAAAGPASQGLTTESLQRACDFLAARDERLAPLILQHGVPERLLAKQGDAFCSLSKSICFQQ